MAILNIDGLDLPAPTKFKLPNFDLDSDSTKRNELGFVQRDRIRANIYKAEFEWEKLSSSQLATIKSAIQPDKFEATIMTEIGPIPKTMYAGDRSIEMNTYNEDYNKILWNISFNLIEY